MNRALSSVIVPAMLAVPLPGVAGDLRGVARTESVLQDASIDGRPAEVERLVARAGAAQAALRIAERWRAVGDPVIGMRVGDWHLVSRLTPQRYDTVQLRDAAGGGSEGFLSRWPHRGPVTDAPLPPWWPASARVLRTVASSDVGRRAVTWVGSIGLAPSPARGLVSARLRAQGWSIRPDPGAPPAGMPTGATPTPPATRSMPLHARRGDASLVMTIEPRADGAAFVVQQWEPRP